jgi:RNA polymerase sigma factor (sigma-70 family)
LLEIFFTGPTHNTEELRGKAMPRPQWSKLVHDLVTRSPAQSPEDELARFVRDRDDRAFEAVVRRYGPMVLATCRRVLRDAHAAEDAFQATFLLLARKAVAGERFDNVGGWLHTTGCRVALALRRQARVRRRYEHVADRAPSPSDGYESDADLARVLDEELTRLPDKYRLPLLLCYLRSQTQAEAAAELGVSVPTVCKRLARGRELLRGRLTVRGIAVSAAGFGTLLAPAAAECAVHPRLLAETVRAATGYALGQVVSGGNAAVRCADDAAVAAVPPAWRKWVLAAATVLTGAVAATLWPAARVPDPPPRPTPPAPAPVASAAGTYPITGRVVDQHGRPVPDARVAVTVPPEPAAAGRWRVNDVLIASGLSGADGRFRLPVPLAAGTDRDFETDTPIKVAAWLPGRPPATASRRAGATWDVELRLPEPAAVRLRLVGPDGAAAVGVAVRVTRYGLLNGESPDEPVLPFWPPVAVSGPDGRVTLDGCSAGMRFQAMIYDDRFARQVIGPADMGGAGPDRETVVKVEPAPPFEVKVCAADTGRPLGGAKVWVTADGSAGRESDFQISGETRADGTFRTPPFAAARFVLSVFPPDGSAYLTVARELDRDPADPDRTSVTVNLPRGVLVRGRVVHGDAPVAGARVQMVPLAVAPGAANPDVRTGSFGVVRTGTDGRFAAGAPAGRVIVMSHAPGDDWVSRPVPPGPDGSPPALTVYAHACEVIDLAAGAVPRELELRPTPGVRARVRVETSTGGVPPDAHVTSRCHVAPLVAGGLKMFPVVDGVAELPGCDAAREYPVVVIDSETEEAGVAVVRAGAETRLRLAPVATAEVAFAGVAADAELVARLVAFLPPDVARGKPAPEPEWPPGVAGHMVVTIRPDVRPGRVPGGADARVRFPELVPGLRYRVEWAVGGTGWVPTREFVPKAAETVALPTVVVRP